MKSVAERIAFYLKQRAGQSFKIGAIVFSLEEGILGKTEEAEQLIWEIQNQNVADMTESQ